jgi:hypothetical protein
MQKVMVMLAALTTLVAPVGVAGADTQDDQFVQTVRSQGIISADAATLILFAHQMCEAAGGPAALGPLSNLMITQGLSAVQASNVAFDATRIYCPDKTPIVPPALAPGP